MQPRGVPIDVTTSRTTGALSPRSSLGGRGLPEKSEFDATDVNAELKWLEKGAVVLKFVMIGKPQVVTLRLKQGSLTWNRDDELLSEENTCHISEIKKLARGKVTDLMLQRTVPHLSPDELCFSVILGPKKTLDFQCRSESHRDRAVAALATAVRAYRAATASSTENSVSLAPSTQRRGTDTRESSIIEREYSVGLGTDRSVGLRAGPPTHERTNSSGDPRLALSPRAAAAAAQRPARSSLELDRDRDRDDYDDRDVSLNGAPRVTARAALSPRGAPLHPAGPGSARVRDDQDLYDQERSLNGQRAGYPPQAVPRDPRAAAVSPRGPPAQGDVRGAAAALSPRGLPPQAGFDPRGAVSPRGQPGPLQGQPRPRPDLDRDDSFGQERAYPERSYNDPRGPPPAMTTPALASGARGPPRGALSPRDAALGYPPNDVQRYSPNGHGVGIGNGYPPHRDSPNGYPDAEPSGYSATAGGYGAAAAEQRYSPNGYPPQRGAYPQDPNGYPPQRAAYPQDADGYYDDRNEYAPRGNAYGAPDDDWEQERIDPRRARPPPNQGRPQYDDAPPRRPYDQPDAYYPEDQDYPADPRAVGRGAPPRANGNGNGRPGSGAADKNLFNQAQNRLADPKAARHQRTASGGRPAAVVSPRKAVPAAPAPPPMSNPRPR